MSLILDALRRADSERDRERGAVPGLHAQQVAVAPEPPPVAGVPPWLWLSSVAGAVLTAALVAWAVAGRDAPRSAAAASSPTAVAPARVAAAAPAPQPAPAIAAAPSAPPRESALPSQPVAEPAPWPSQDNGRKATSAGPVSAPAAEVKTATAAAIPVEAAVVRREQLPENIRAQLPPLAVGGSIYSASPSDRSIIIDGRLLRENDRLTADLALEQIRPKSAVLRFRGQRFEIGF